MSLSTKVLAPGSHITFQSFHFITVYRWFSRYVIASMLVDENKRSLVDSKCSSTSNCTLQYCYPSLERVVANHLLAQWRRMHAAVFIDQN